MNQLWVDEHNHLVYQNGTVDGTDADGTPVYGIWTSDLNDHDRLALELAKKKKEAWDEFQAEFPGTKLPFANFNVKPFPPFQHKYKCGPHLLVCEDGKHHDEYEDIGNRAKDIEKRANTESHEELIIAMRNALVANRH